MKKIVSFLLAALMMVCSISPSFAYNPDAASPYKSETISSYSARLTRLDDGNVRLFFEVYSSNGTATSIGAQLVELYSASGMPINAIHGSKSNGMIVENIGFCAAEYTIKITTPVYAKVTVFCQRGNLYDSRVITTNIV